MILSQVYPIRFLERIMMYHGDFQFGGYVIFFEKILFLSLYCRSYDLLVTELLKELLNSHLKGNARSITL
jgi:hypothetical protein